jgi:hypothetical protein
VRTPLPLRPPRWSIHLLCGLSLLIFLLAMGIWVPSYFVGNELEWERQVSNPLEHPIRTRRVTCTIAFKRGAVGVYVSRGQGLGSGDTYSRWSTGRETYPSSLIAPPEPFERVNVRLGNFQFVYSPHDLDRGDYSHYRVVLPLWLFGLFAIPPGLWVRRWRRGRGGRGFAVQLVETAA